MAIPTTHGNFDESDVINAVAGDGMPDPLPASPMPLFKVWFDEAHAKRVQPNPNAFTLATATPDARPSARIVLCKGLDASPQGGWIVFHTNYHGRKGRELEANPHAAAVFHWDALDRQARLEGPVARVSEAESDVYFQTRPWIRRVGAWTSDQSEPIASRDALAAKLDAALRRFGLDPSNLPPPGAKLDIPRPPHWGGYRLFARRVELWCRGEARLHDRAAWTRELTPAHAPASAWASTRLQP